ncbi:MAG: gamma-glutamyltransferase, partial [Gemmataceae bacterium]
MARLAALLWLFSVSRLLAGETGVVVSVSPPATQVGMDILARGGNAVDAAVATGFALAVTWPEAGNIGGGGFMLIRPPGKESEAVVVDFRATAPALADKNLFVRHGRKPYLTVGVPGSVAGMALAHARLGKLPWKSLVEPAVRLADEGFLLDAGTA